MNTLVSWIAAIWQTILNHLRPSAIDVEPEYTPIGSTIMAAAHCINCDHRGLIWTPVGEVELQLENRILDMLRCPMCGLYTMCSA